MRLVLKGLSHPPPPSPSASHHMLSASKGTSLVAQMVKSLPAIRKIWVPSLGQEDLLEKEVATHSSILAWRIPWMEEPLGLQSVHGVTKNQTQLSNFHIYTH